jgi:hypothetical protein
MMGFQGTPARLFYDFCLDDYFLSDHLPARLDGHLDLDGLRQTLKPFYSQTAPAGKELVQFRRTYAIPRSGVTAGGTRIYRASKLDCDVCKLKAQCCPNAFARTIPQDLDEDARDVPVRTPQR